MQAALAHPNAATRVRHLFGRSAGLSDYDWLDSGEAVQMRFTAPRGSDGWVMVQPYEERPVTAAR